MGPVYEHRADGTGNATRRVPLAPMDFGQIVPSRDGRWLLLRTRGQPTGNGDIFGSRPGDTTAVPLVATPARAGLPRAVARRRVAGLRIDESGDAGDLRAAVSRDAARPSGRSPPPAARQPVWASSGKELFYLNGKKEMVRRTIRPGATFTVGEQQVLFSVGAVRFGGADSVLST